MGRILRKKDLQKTKKKKNTEPGSLIQENAETAAEQALAAAVPDRDTGKKQFLPQKKSLPAGTSAQSGTVKNFLEKGLQFLREVKMELKKVTWPSRKQTMGSTLVVIILVIIISLFLGVVDISLSNLIRLVFK